MTAIISLAHAKAEGLTRYFTGVACKHGHVAERLVSSRACIVCTQQRLVSYKLKNRTVLLEKKRNAQKLYIEKYPEKIVATRKATVAKHRKARNAEKAAWAKRNSGRVLAWCRQRQLAKFQRTPVWLSEDDLWVIEQAYELAALRTRTFGFSWHVDHILPLRGKKVSGLHVPANLQVISGSENSRKGNRMEVAHG
jgi:5-methylcytosine-specific restriction endonuclease McrA